MNKTELIDAVSQNTGQPKNVVKQVVEAVVDTTLETLKGGEDVNVSGFGTYKMKVRAQREGRNPATGERVTIAERKAVHFKVAPAASTAINGR